MFKLNSKPKRIIFVLILTLLVSAFSTTFLVLFNTKTSVQKIEAPRADGLVINSPSDWNNFADAVNAGTTYEGQTVTLGNDISGTDSNYIILKAVGTTSRPFKGTFNGNNKTIKNFKINTETFKYLNGSGNLTMGVGLFNDIDSAKIFDLSLENGLYKFEKNFGSTGALMKNTHFTLYGGFLICSSNHTTKFSEIDRCSVVNCKFSLTSTDVIFTNYWGNQKDINDGDIGSREYNFSGLIHNGYVKINDCMAYYNSFETNLNNDLFNNGRKSYAIGPDSTWTDMQVNHCITTGFDLKFSGIGLRSEKVSSFSSTNCIVSTDNFSDCVTKLNNGGFSWSSIGGTYNSSISGRNKTWYYYPDGYPIIRGMLNNAWRSGVTIEARTDNATTLDSEQTIRIRDIYQSSVGYDSTGGTAVIYYPDPLSWPYNSANNVTTNPINVLGHQITAVAKQNSEFNQFELNSSVNTQIVRFRSICDITYDVNKPSEATSQVQLSKNKDEDKYYGEVIQLPEASLNGYRCTGWYTEKTGGSYVGNAGDDYEVRQTITLYAQWDGLEYNITYYDRGNSDLISCPEASGLPGKYKCGVGLTLLDPNERLGYEFQKWYKGFNSGESVTEISTSTYGDQKFYADWKLLEYDIIFNFIYDNENGSQIPSSGPSTDSYPKKYTIKDSITLPTPSKTGYSFSNYWEIISCDGKIYNKNVGDEISTIPTNSHGKVKLICHYTATTYNINYYDWDSSLNNKAYTGSNVVSYYIYSVGTSIGEPTRTAYNFVGWADEYDGSTIKPYVISTSDLGDKTLYAKWEPINYTISYNLNASEDYPTSTYTAVNNDGISTNLTRYTIETTTFSLTQPTRNYFKFIGFIVESLDNGSNINNGITVFSGNENTLVENDSNLVTQILQNSYGNVTLKAIWGYATWTVTLNKGINPANNNENINIVQSANCANATFITSNDGNYTITLKTFDKINLECDYINNEYIVKITKDGVDYTFKYCLHGKDSNNKEFGEEGYVCYLDPLWKYTIEKTNEAAKVGQFSIVDGDDTNYSLTLNSELTASVVDPSNIQLSFTPNFVLKQYNIG